MTKKEISNNVFDALPIEVRESKLTINQKKILNVLFNYSTLDKSIENGSFFISNEQLLKEAELEYPTQLQRVLSFLITNKFIERIAGTRSLKNNTSIASTYTINVKELIEYCEKHPQKTTKKGNVSKGNVSKGNGVKNVTDVTVIDELRKEIELLKVRINKLEMGNSNGNGNKITNVTTDTDIDIDPEINKKYNIHVNIPEVINKNKFIKHDANNINIDNSDEIFLSNFMKVDNINTGNSDVEIKDLRIEENINLNNESEMNEERMNGMNNIINSNETYMNTPTLEEILETQALDDNQAFNTFSSFKNKETNYSKPEQERYQRLFNKCKSQIEIWMKTHEYSCISIFDSFYKVIQYMHQNKTISDKQWEAAQHYLLQRFMNLRNGYSKYLQNKKKTISSMELNESNNPQPPRQQNDQMEEVM